MNLTLLGSFLSFQKQMRELRNIKGGCAVDFSGLNVSCIGKEETVGLDCVALQDPSEFSVSLLPG